MDHLAFDHIVVVVHLGAHNHHRRRLHSHRRPFDEAEAVQMELHNHLVVHILAGHNLAEAFEVVVLALDCIDNVVLVYLGMT